MDREIVVLDLSLIHISPSIPMLMYALVASVSGVKILLAGIVPGILLMLVLMAFVAYLAKKKNFPYGNIHISRKEKVKLQLHGCLLYTSRCV